ncbi:hypothetical protein BS78_06G210300 [Paspalum vaginatum]|nr:hypothetical protein BS78_06G210300 [Paspalum vaginatum]
MRNIRASLTPTIFFFFPGFCFCLQVRAICQGQPSVPKLHVTSEPLLHCSPPHRRAQAISEANKIAGPDDDGPPRHRGQRQQQQRRRGHRRRHGGASLDVAKLRRALVAGGAVRDALHGAASWPPLIFQMIWCATCMVLDGK